MRRLSARPPVEAFTSTTQRTLENRSARCTDADAARSQWADFKKKARVSHAQLRTALGILNGYRCFYCDTDDGDAIDHFEAIARAPQRAFDWDNHYLSCTQCNSVFKANRFDQRPAAGGRGLLDPFTVDPPAQFDCNDEGYLSGRTPEAQDTIYVLGLGSRHDVPERQRAHKKRKDAWQRFLHHIRAYATAQADGDADEAAYCRSQLKTNACHVVLMSLVRQARGPRGADLYPRIAAALAAHPEIIEWAGLSRTGG